MNFIKHKKISVVLSFVLILILLSSCSNHNSNDELADNSQNDVFNDIVKSDTLNEKLLTDGFWITDKDLNSDNDEYRYASNDFGFVFSSEKTYFEKCAKNNLTVARNGYDEARFDGIALTTSQYVWYYLINSNNELEIYRPYSNSDSVDNRLMFVGKYDKEQEVIYLYFMEAANDYYETLEEDCYVVLSHEKNNLRNNFIKSLCFETWSTVNPSQLNYNNNIGYENLTHYNQLRSELFDITPNVDIYRFLYNYREFDLSEGNAKQIHSSDGEKWTFNAHIYKIIREGEMGIELKPYEGRNTYVYLIDKDYSVLTLENFGGGEQIYRLTYFTE